MSSRIPPYAIRPARPEDVAVVVRHRIEMFRDMGVLPDHDCAALERGSRRFLRRAIPAGESPGGLAGRAGPVWAGGGVVLRARLPRPGHNDGGVEAYVLNVYTDPAHRRRGLARALMAAILEWGRAQGLAKGPLAASEEGRPLYQSLGFTATNEMEWTVSRGAGESGRPCPVRRAPKMQRNHPPHPRT